jgi:hypothetical protein
MAAGSGEAAGVTEGRGDGVAGRGEASAVTWATTVAEGGAVVAVLMMVASAGGGVGETIVSCSGAQAARESKRKKQMNISCLMNR